MKALPQEPPASRAETWASAAPPGAPGGQAPSKTPARSWRHQSPPPTHTPSKQPSVLMAWRGDKTGEKSSELREEAAKTVPWRKQEHSPLASRPCCSPRFGERLKLRVPRPYKGTVPWSLRGPILATCTAVWTLVHPSRSLPFPPRHARESTRHQGKRLPFPSTATGQKPSLSPSHFGFYTPLPQA